MRHDVVTDWIAGTEWAAWARQPVQGDASARSYDRLVGASGTTVILMNAPPDTCGSQSDFVRIGSHLRSLGLAAPEVLEWNDTLGLLVLEDLGQMDFASHLRADPGDEASLYEAATDILKIIGSAPPPANLQVMTPTRGVEMIEIAFDWAAADKSDDLSGAITTNLKDLLKTFMTAPSTLSLRDFHAENLIWRPELSGAQRVGLLDFQDAFVTHPTYDLASLLRDARRDVSPDLTDALLARLGGDEGTRSAFHVIAVQRNLRILGIFERLAQVEGKTRYRNFVPRVRQHLRTDLAAPCLKDIAPLIRKAFNLEGAGHD